MIGNTLAERITGRRNPIYDNDYLKSPFSMAPYKQQCGAGGDNITFGRLITEMIYKQKNWRR